MLLLCSHVTHLIAFLQMLFICKRLTALPTLTLHLMPKVVLLTEAASRPPAYCLVSEVLERFGKATED